MDQGGLIAPFRERTVCQFASVVESGMMLRFAASRLCGRARDGSLAVIVVVSLDLAGSIAEPASL